MGIAGDIIIIILAGLLTGLVANRLKIPPIIGYIVAGIIIGPFTGGVTVSDIPRIEMLAEIGVALLLFSIGLDFSFRELKAVRAIAFIGTPLQILVLMASGFGIGRYLGLSWNASLVFGMIISLSSTMVVLKSLMSRGLVGTLSSRVMIGILIIQDLAAIPMMLIIPELNAAGGGIASILLVLLKAAVLLFAIVLVGVRIVPWLLKFVVRLNSRELFLITVTALGLGIGYLTHLAGLSLAFGAFVAGMVINESDYSHQAMNDIIPLRDIFGLVFFTSIGMLLDPSFILGNISLVLILVGLVIACKFVVFSLLGASFRYFNIIPLAMGLGLSQIGEFSFVLARTARASGAIEPDLYSLMLSVSVLTMILSPLLSQLTVPLFSLKRKWFKHEQIRTLNLPFGGLRDHIVIAGGGRVGFQIASILNKAGFPFIVIEQDFRKFEKTKREGYPVVFGDAGSEPVLSASGIAAARLLIVTIPLITTARDIITTALHHNPGVKIIARADDLSQLDELFRLKVFEVVQPEFEAGLEIIRQSLMLLDVPLSSIYSLTDNIRRRSRSRFSLENIQSLMMENIKKTPFLMETSWIEVLEDSPLSGRSIREMAVRSSTGVSIVGVLRGNEFLPNPDAEFVFQARDFIAVIGLPQSRNRFMDTMISSKTKI